MYKKNHVKSLKELEESAHQFFKKEEEKAKFRVKCEQVRSEYVSKIIDLLKPYITEADPDYYRMLDHNESVNRLWEERFNGIYVDTSFKYKGEYRTHNMPLYKLLIFERIKYERNIEAIEERLQNKQRVITNNTQKKSTIKAIETEYQGYLFRSRLEARWAVFLDAANETWEYEKEGYELPSGKYLPDFWLPRLKCWLEIKGQEPNDREMKMCDELHNGTGHPVIIVWGLPVEPKFGTLTYQDGQKKEGFIGHNMKIHHKLFPSDKSRWNGAYWIYENQKLGIAFNWHAFDFMILQDNISANNDQNALVPDSLYNKAKRARFEHIAVR